jgi:phage gp36-like protein
MPYCTQTDITNFEMTPAELLTLSDDPKAGVIRTDQVTAAISKGDAEIDAYCQGRYAVPFSPVPPIVAGWSATLAAFNLYRNRPKPSTLLDRYNKVMSWLQAISDGKRAIPGMTTDSYSLPGSTTDGCVQEFQKQQTDSSGDIVQNGTMEVW